MLTVEFYQQPEGDRRRPRCAACPRKILDGEFVMIWKIRDIAVPFDQRQQYTHVSCVRNVIGATPVADDIDDVIAGVRELVSDFAQA